MQSKRCRSGFQGATLKIKNILTLDGENYLSMMGFPSLHAAEALVLPPIVRKFADKFRLGHSECN